MALKMGAFTMENKQSQSTPNTTLRCHSQYITLRDGIRLAVSIWMPEKGLPSPQARPAVLNTTRYWRAMALSDDQPEFQPFYSQAAWLWQQGYVFVVADARGSGASFGSREAEISPAEVADIGEIIDWLAEQSWCDGRVATTGTSYTANTTLHSLATGANALQLGVCRAADFDIYRHLMAPGGIVNSWFINNWGGSTAVQDANDTEALREAGSWISMGGAADNIVGVRPVDNDSNGRDKRGNFGEYEESMNPNGPRDENLLIDVSLSGECKGIRSGKGYVDNCQDLSFTTSAGSREKALEKKK